MQFMRYPVGVSEVCAARDSARQLLDSVSPGVTREELLAFCRLSMFYWGLNQQGRDATKPGFMANFPSWSAAVKRTRFGSAIQALWRQPLSVTIDSSAVIWADRHSFPGAGSSLISLLLHLRAPNQFLPWFKAAHEGVRRLHPGVAPWRPNGDWQHYEAYNHAAWALVTDYALDPREADTFFATVDSLCQEQGPDHDPHVVASDLRIAREWSDASGSAPHQANQLMGIRQWQWRLMALRRGQPQFRRRLIDAYGGRCAMTGCAIPDVLEAAHIIPYKDGGTNPVSNGLLLRADVHTLFDLFAISVGPDYRIFLNPALLSSDAYGALHGKRLHLPADGRLHPDRQALSEHCEVAARRRRMGSLPGPLKEAPASET